MAFAYTDGDVEVDIKQIIEDQESRSSLQRYEGADYENWHHRYHLSPTRGNLLRHLDFSGLDVLELGAGIGGVSHYLSEHCRWLTVVEGSQRRYDALASRLRGQNNWDGIVANLESVDLTRKYDVVCVVGVMEYAELYTTLADDNAASPAEWFLTRAAQHLKEDGVLILAIENKLGLKYWRGAAEDHLGTIFSGISGYPISPTVRTYSRRELLDLFTAIGFPSVNEYYPYPDYKLPNTILSKKFVDQWPELAVDLTSSRFYQDSDYSNTQLFPESLAGRSVARAGLLSDMANSFLFLASRTAESRIMGRLLRRQADQKEVAWHYGTERRDPIATVFYLTDEKQLHVYKVSLIDHSRPDDKTLVGEDGMTLHWHAVDDAVVVDAQPLRTILLSHAYFGRWDAWRLEMLSFFAWSLRTWAMPEDEAGTAMMNGRAVDAGIFNAVVPNELVYRMPSAALNRYKVFDLEFTVDGAIPVTWFILRNLFIYEQSRSPLLPMAPTETLEELYFELCSELDLAPRYEDDILREARFFSLVWSSPLERAQEIVSGTMKRQMPKEAVPLQSWQALDRMRGNKEAIGLLQAQLEERMQILNSRTHRLADKVCSLLINTRKFVSRE